MGLRCRVRGLSFTDVRVYSSGFGVKVQGQACGGLALFVFGTGVLGLGHPPL